MSNLFNEVFAVSGTRKQPSVGVMDVTVNGRKGEGTMKKNELRIFVNAEFGQIRTVEVDGEPCFVANDIAKALGYSNPSKATKDHCKKAIMVWGNDSLGRRKTRQLLHIMFSHTNVRKYTAADKILNKGTLKFSGTFEMRG